jgi:hypothetical protein
MYILESVGFIPLNAIIGKNLELFNIEINQLKLYCSKNMKSQQINEFACQQKNNSGF